MPSLCGRSAKVRIKQRLSLQKDTCQGKQSVGDTTESTSVRVATFAQRSISGTTLGIAVGGDTCPVIDRVAQSDVRSIAPDDNKRLAAALGNRRGTGQRPEPFVVTAADGPRGLREQCAEIDPADTRHGSQDRNVSPLKAFSRCLLAFANRRAELIEFSFGLTELMIHNA